ncbi:titin homolog [Leptidea sinapis]|uniref:titin homolog n=1 Tax=Leptidea sinapis TaxID=189913 RepID=UPI0021C2EAF6|nr:titin homolog [Leptidea sinapis]
MDHEEDKSLSLGTEVSASAPPPSPLTGCYLLAVIGEPHTQEHKEIILQRLVKGLLSWDSSEHQVDLEKELATLTAQAPEGEEARNGERLIQYASENLVTEILIHPQMNTLMQCMRNLLSSFTRHRHLVHAGYTFGGNGSWIMQDGTFSLADFTDAYQENEVQRVIRAYENSISIDIHCSVAGGEWTNLPNMPFVKHCKIRVNPTDKLDSGSKAIKDFTAYLEPYVVPASLEQLLVPSDVVGNIRFTHPTLYVFPGGQGDAALFGINGFNMLVDGGFSRKACWWDFARHLDRLDAVLLTRLNNCSASGIAAVLRRKATANVYPQIGHFFCNLEERRGASSPDGDKDGDPLLVSLMQMGGDMMGDLRHINLKPQHCYRSPDPVNLYHKVGHGTLDMYVLNPSKDSKYVREFLKEWHNSEHKLFEGATASGPFNFPIPNLVSICALLVWHPASPEDNITRIMFPGSTPQHKIFEGLERLKHLEFLQHPTFTGKQMTPTPVISQTRTAAPVKYSKVVSTKVVKDKVPSDKKDERLLEAEFQSLKIDKIKDDVSRNIIDNKLISELVDEGEKQLKSVIQDAIIARGDLQLDNKFSHDETTVVDGLTKKGESKKRDKVFDKKLKRSDIPDTYKDVTHKGELKKGTDIDDKPKIESKKKSEKFRNETMSTAIHKSGKINQRLQSNKVIEKKILSSVITEKKATDEKKSPPITPKKITDIKLHSQVLKEKSKIKLRKMSPGSTPAKSVKDASNRRVVESRYKQVSPKRDLTGKAPEKKETKTKREPISRRPRPVSSPVKGLKSSKSPIKSTKTTKSEPSKLKGLQRVNYEDILKEAKKSDEDTSRSFDDIKQQEIDEREEQEIVREIEAVFNRDSEAEEKIEFVGRSDIEKITYLLRENKTNEIIDGDFEDEYLIIEKEEVDAPENIDKTELQKHLQDAQETEKNKGFRDDDADDGCKYISIEQAKKAESEHSISVEEKQDRSSEKKTLDSKGAVVKLKDSVENILHESHHDEKISNTVESGATTAPTLPEDEKITLDEIKENGQFEQKDVEPLKQTTSQQVMEKLQKPTNFEKKTLHDSKPMPIRDIVKTPDEVADLPLHEEVDYRTFDDKKISHKFDPNIKDLRTSPKDLTLPIHKDMTVQQDLVIKTIERPSHAELVTVTPGSAPESPMYQEQFKIEQDSVKEFGSTEFSYQQYTEKLSETHITTLDSPNKNIEVVVDLQNVQTDKIPSIPEDIEKEMEEEHGLKHSELNLVIQKDVDKIVADVAEILKSDKSLEELIAEKSPIITSEDKKNKDDTTPKLMTTEFGVTPQSLQNTPKTDKLSMVVSDSSEKSAERMSQIQKQVSPIKSIESEEISDISEKTILSDGKKTSGLVEDNSEEKSENDSSKTRISVTLDSARTLEKLEEKIAELKELDLCQMESFINETKDDIKIIDIKRLSDNFKHESKDAIDKLTEKTEISVKEKKKEGKSVIGSFMNKFDEKLSKAKGLFSRKPTQNMSQEKDVQKIEETQKETLHNIEEEFEKNLTVEEKYLLELIQFDTDIQDFLNQYYIYSEPDYNINEKCEEIIENGIKIQRFTVTRTIRTKLTSFNGTVHKMKTTAIVTIRNVYPNGTFNVKVSGNTILTDLDGDDEFLVNELNDFNLIEHKSISEDKKQKDLKINDKYIKEIIEIIMTSEILTNKLKKAYKIKNTATKTKHILISDLRYITQIISVTLADYDMKTKKAIGREKVTKFLVTYNQLETDLDHTKDEKQTQKSPVIDRVPEIKGQDLLAAAKVSHLKEEKDRSPEKDLDEAKDMPLVVEHAKMDAAKSPSQVETEQKPGKISSPELSEASEKEVVEEKVSYLKEVKVKSPEKSLDEERVSLSVDKLAKVAIGKVPSPVDTEKEPEKPSSLALIDASETELDHTKDEKQMQKSPLLDDLPELKGHDLLPDAKISHLKEEKDKSPEKVLDEARAMPLVTEQAKIDAAKSPSPVETKQQPGKISSPKLSGASEKELVDDEASYLMEEKEKSPEQDVDEAKVSLSVDKQAKEDIGRVPSPVDTEKETEKPSSSPLIDASKTELERTKDEKQTQKNPVLDDLPELKGHDLLADAQISHLKEEKDKSPEKVLDDARELPLVAEQAKMDAAKSPSPVKTKQQSGKISSPELSKASEKELVEEKVSFLKEVKEKSQEKDQDDTKVSLSVDKLAKLDIGKVPSPVDTVYEPEKPSSPALIDASQTELDHAKDEKQTQKSPVLDDLPELKGHDLLADAKISHLKEEKDKSPEKDQDAAREMPLFEEQSKMDAAKSPSIVESNQTPGKLSSPEIIKANEKELVNDKVSSLKDVKEKLPEKDLDETKVSLSVDKQAELDIEKAPFPLDTEKETGKLPSLKLSDASDTELDHAKGEKQTHRSPVIDHVPDVKGQQDLLADAKVSHLKEEKHKSPEKDLDEAREIPLVVEQSKMDAAKSPSPGETTQEPGKISSPELSEPIEKELVEKKLSSLKEEKEKSPEKYLDETKISLSVDKEAELDIGKVPPPFDTEKQPAKSTSPTLSDANDTELDHAKDEKQTQKSPVIDHVPELKGQDLLADAKVSHLKKEKDRPPEKDEDAARELPLVVDQAIMDAAKSPSPGDTYQQAGKISSPELNEASEKELVDDKVSSLKEVKEKSPEKDQDETKASISDNKKAELDIGKVPSPVDAEKQPAKPSSPTLSDASDTELDHSKDEKQTQKSPVTDHVPELKGQDLLADAKVSHSTVEKEKSPEKDLDAAREIPLVEEQPKMDAAKSSSPVEIKQQPGKISSPELSDPSEKELVEEKLSSLKEVKEKSPEKVLDEMKVSLSVDKKAELDIEKVPSPVGAEKQPAKLSLPILSDASDTELDHAKDEKQTQKSPAIDHVPDVKGQDLLADAKVSHLKKEKDKSPEKDLDAAMEIPLVIEQSKKDAAKSPSPVEIKQQAGKISSPELSELSEKELVKEKVSFLKEVKVKSPEKDLDETKVSLSVDKKAELDIGKVPSPVDTEKQPAKLSSPTLSYASDTEIDHAKDEKKTQKSPITDHVPDGKGQDLLADAKVSHLKEEKDKSPEKDLDAALEIPLVEEQAKMDAAKSPSPGETKQQPGKISSPELSEPIEKELVEEKLSSLKEVKEKSPEKDLDEKKVSLSVDKKAESDIGKVPSPVETEKQPAKPTSPTLTDASDEELDHAKDEKQTQKSPVIDHVPELKGQDLLADAKVSHLKVEKDKSPEKDLDTALEIPLFEEKAKMDAGKSASPGETKQQPGKISSPELSEASEKELVDDKVSSLKEVKEKSPEKDLDDTKVSLTVDKKAELDIGKAPSPIGTEKQPAKPTSPTLSDASDTELDHAKDEKQTQKSPVIDHVPELKGQDLLADAKVSHSKEEKDKSPEKDLDAAREIPLVVEQSKKDASKSPSPVETNQQPGKISSPELSEPIEKELVEEKLSSFKEVKEKSPEKDLDETKVSLSVDKKAELDIGKLPSPVETEKQPAKPTSPTLSDANDTELDHAKDEKQTQKSPVIDHVPELKGQDLLADAKVSHLKKEKDRSPEKDEDAARETPLVVDQAIMDAAKSPSPGDTNQQAGKISSPELSEASEKELVDDKVSSLKEVKEKSPEKDLDETKVSLSVDKKTESDIGRVPSPVETEKQPAKPTSPTLSDASDKELDHAKDEKQTQKSPVIDHVPELKGQDLLADAKVSHLKVEKDKSPEKDLDTALEKPLFEEQAKMDAGKSASPGETKQQPGKISSPELSRAYEKELVDDKVTYLKEEKEKSAEKDLDDTKVSLTVDKKAELDIGKAPSPIDTEKQPTKPTSPTLSDANDTELDHAKDEKQTQKSPVIDHVPELKGQDLLADAKVSHSKEEKDKSPEKDLDAAREIPLVVEQSKKDASKSPSPVETKQQPGKLLSPKLSEPSEKELVEEKVSSLKEVKEKSPEKDLDETKVSLSVDKEAKLDIGKVPSPFDTEKQPAKPTSPTLSDANDTELDHAKDEKQTQKSPVIDHVPELKGQDLLADAKVSHSKEEKDKSPEKDLDAAREIPLVVEQSKKDASKSPSPVETKQQPGKISSPELSGAYEKELVDEKVTYLKEEKEKSPEKDLDETKISLSVDKETELDIGKVASLVDTEKQPARPTSPTLSDANDTELDHAKDEKPMQKRPVIDHVPELKGQDLLADAKVSHLKEEKDKSLEKDEDAAREILLIVDQAKMDVAKRPSPGDTKQEAGKISSPKLSETCQKELVDDKVSSLKEVKEKSPQKDLDETKVSLSVDKKAELDIGKVPTPVDTEKQPAKPTSPTLSDASDTELDHAKDEKQTQKSLVIDHVPELKSQDLLADAKVSHLKVEKDKFPEKVLDAALEIPLFEEQAKMDAAKSASPVETIQQPGKKSSPEISEPCEKELVEEKFSSLKEVKEKSPEKDLYETKVSLSVDKKAELDIGNVPSPVETEKQSAKPTSPTLSDASDKELDHAKDEKQTQKSPVIDHVPDGKGQDLLADAKVSHSKEERDKSPEKDLDEAWEVPLVVEQAKMDAAKVPLIVESKQSPGKISSLELRKASEEELVDDKVSSLKEEKEKSPAKDLDATKVSLSVDKQAKVDIGRVPSPVDTEKQPAKPSSPTLSDEIDTELDHAKDEKQTQKSPIIDNVPELKGLDLLADAKVSHLNKGKDKPSEKGLDEAREKPLVVEQAKIDAKQQPGKISSAELSEASEKELVNDKVSCLKEEKEKSPEKDLDKAKVSHLKEEKDKSPEKDLDELREIPFVVEKAKIDATKSPSPVETKQQPGRISLPELSEASQKVLDHKKDEKQIQHSPVSGLGTEIDDKDSVNDKVGQLKGKKDQTFERDLDEVRKSHTGVDQVNIESFKITSRIEPKQEPVSLTHSVGKLKTETDTITKIIKEGENVVTQTITTVTTKEIISKDDGTPQSIKTTIETTTLSKSSDGSTTTTKDTQTTLSECSSSLKSISHMDVDTRNETLEGDLTTSSEINALLDNGCIEIVEDDKHKKILNQYSSNKMEDNIQDSNIDTNKTVTVTTTDHYPDGSSQTKEERNGSALIQKVENVNITDIPKFPLDSVEKTSERSADEIGELIEDCDIKNELIQQGPLTINRTITTRTRKENLPSENENLKRIRTTVETTTDDQYPDGSIETTKDVKVTISEYQKASDNDLEAALFGFVQTGKTKSSVDKKVNNIISDNGENIKQHITTNIRKEEFRHKETNEVAVKTVTETITENIRDKVSVETTKDVRTQMMYLPVGTEFEELSPAASNDELYLNTDNEEAPESLTEKIPILTNLNFADQSQTQHSSDAKTKKRSPVGEITTDTETFTKIIKEGDNEVKQTITIVTTKEVISPEKVKITIETTTVSKGNDGVTKTTKSTKTTISEFKEEFEEIIDTAIEEHKKISGPDVITNVTAKYDIDQENAPVCEKKDSVVILKEIKGDSKKKASTSSHETNAKKTWENKELEK